MELIQKRVLFYKPHAVDGNQLPTDERALKLEAGGLSRHSEINNRVPSNSFVECKKKRFVGGRQKIRLLIMT